MRQPVWEGDGQPEYGLPRDGQDCRPRCGWLLLLLPALMLTIAGCTEPTDADRAKALIETVLSARGRQRVEVTEAVLDLAERRADAGDTKTAERIYRTLWDASAAPDRRHVRCAAIRGLARVRGPAAVEEVASAMAGEDEQVAAAALAAAACAGGEDVTRAWADSLPSAPRAVRPKIVRVLGRRGGPVAEAAILAAVDSEDGPIRRAAIEAAGRLATPRAVGPLVALLGADDAGDRDAAEAALAHLAGRGVSAAVAERLAEAMSAVPVERGGSPHPPRNEATHALGAAGPETHRAVSLIRVLAARAARGQADAVAACLAGGPAEVQTAALEALAVLGGPRHVPAVLGVLVETANGEVREAAETALTAIGTRSQTDRVVPQVVRAMEDAGPAGRCALLRVLGEAPTEVGLSAVRQAMRDEDEAVRLAAVRVASAWPAAAPAPDLLAVAHEAEEAKVRILAVRGVIRLTGRMEDPAARTRLLGRALAAAERVQEKRLALAALAGVPAPEALAVALSHMQEPSLVDEAAAAAVGVAEGIAETHPAEARRALEAVLESTEAARIRERAGRLLGRLEEGGR